MWSLPKNMLNTEGRNWSKNCRSKSEHILNFSADDDETKNLLSDKDIYQAELMYSGRNAKVYVCRCLANLYFGQIALDGDSKSRWRLIVTGIPVVLLSSTISQRYHGNRGAQIKPPRMEARQVSIVLAEKGTGFTLWKEIVDDFSYYTRADANFHTMVTSNEPHRLAGLSFDHAFSALQFYHHLISFSTGLADNVPLMPVSKLYYYSASNNSGKRSSTVCISRPVDFCHVTSMKPDDLEMSLSGRRYVLNNKRFVSCVDLKQNY